VRAVTIAFRSAEQIEDRARLRIGSSQDVSNNADCVGTSTRLLSIGLSP
jgi:hypothetical protein